MLSDAPTEEAPKIGAQYAQIAQTATSSEANDAAQQVPVTDKNGRAVENFDGKPMLRPAGLPPDVFLAAGAKVTEYARTYPEGSLTNLLSDLTKFRQGGNWDAQRVGGAFHAEFVDYATVAIGLYAGAAGMTEDEILTIENFYARNFSNFGNVEMDRVYTHLRPRNVWNTRLGFSLFRSGRIAP